MNDNEEKSNVITLFPGKESDEQAVLTLLKLAIEDATRDNAVAVAIVTINDEGRSTACYAHSSAKLDLLGAVEILKQGVLEG